VVVYRCVVLWFVLLVFVFRLVCMSDFGVFLFLVCMIVFIGVIGGFGFYFFLDDVCEVSV